VTANVSVPGGPFFFFFIATLGSLLPGWYALCRAYPDTEERGRLLCSQALLRSRVGRGIGSARLGSTVTFAAYERGLRIDMLRLVGPFSRPMFIPWSDVSIFRSTSRFSRFFAQTNLSFRHSRVMMNISNEVDARFRREARTVWPKRPPA